MKVIDIMYKIANGEEVPKKIIYEDEIYSFRKDLNDYQNEYGTYADDITHFKYLFENPYGADYKEFFNQEVEATEEGGEIEKLKKLLDQANTKNLELIEAINKQEGLIEKAIRFINETTEYYSDGVNEELLQMLKGSDKE